MPTVAERAKGSRDETTSKNATPGTDGHKGKEATSFTNSMKRMTTNAMPKPSSKSKWW